MRQHVFSRSLGLPIRQSIVQGMVEKRARGARREVRAV